jgi:hypothetical protein
MILILNPKRIVNSDVKWRSQDEFKSETFTAVKILHTLGDHIMHCEKAFLKNESKSFIQRIRNYPLR